MSIEVGSSPITVTGVGRMFAPGDSGTHVVKIVNAATGLDVVSGSTTISMTGGTSGAFTYGALAGTVTLAANGTYYILSQETSGGDAWYDLNTAVITTSAASVTGCIYSLDGVTYTYDGSPGYSYGPVSFIYQ
jgi:hypothetical protein